MFKPCTTQTQRALVRAHMQAHKVHGNKWAGELMRMSGRSRTAMATPDAHAG